MSSAPAAPGLRPLVDSDLDGVLALNERWVPHVSTLDRDRLVQLVGQCSLSLVAVPAAAGAVAAAVADAEVAGVVLVLAPGADHRSPNYRWFSDRYAARPGSGAGGFRYVDRIAVAPAHQGTGIGRALYDSVVEHARAGGASWVAAEVNVDPPNPGSLAFHHHLGFVEVGRRGGEQGSPLVAMLELELDPA